MASEYLKWKYRDEKPEEKVELTAEEKRKNWWHYNKWYLLIGAVLTAMAVSIACSMLGVGRTRPDYQIAYVALKLLPDDTAAAIEDLFASYGEDLNGDGQVSVKLSQYLMDPTDPNTYMAYQVSLMGDFEECGSYFYLMEDPEWFQENFQVLCNLDGSLPEDGDLSAQGKYLRWTDCPVLAQAELGSYTYELLGQQVTGDSSERARRLCLARRGFWTDQTVAYPEGCEALWNTLTQGADT